MAGSRALSKDERRLIDLVAERLDENTRKGLLRDAAEATVTVDGNFLLFGLKDYDRPDQVGHSVLPIEGKLRDLLGGPVSAVINTDRNGRVLEIEFIWWENEGGTPLDWSTLEIAAGDRQTW